MLKSMVYLSNISGQAVVCAYYITVKGHCSGRRDALNAIENYGCCIIVKTQQIWIRLTLLSHRKT